MAQTRQTRTQKRANDNPFLKDITSRRQNHILPEVPTSPIYHYHWVLGQLGGKDDDNSVYTSLNKHPALQGTLVPAGEIPSLKFCERAGYYRVKDVILARFDKRMWKYYQEAQVVKADMQMAELKNKAANKFTDREGNSVIKVYDKDGEASELDFE